MKIRHATPEDRAWLDAEASRVGFEYPVDHSRIELLAIVEDDSGNPVMACAAERIVQLYLWPGTLPTVGKIRAIRMLHGWMSPRLKEKGYSNCEAYLPPSIAERFGRRLERSFSWIRNWPSWTRKL